MLQRHPEACFLRPVALGLSLALLLLLAVPAHGHWDVSSFVALSSERHWPSREQFLARMGIDPFDLDDLPVSMDYVAFARHLFEQGGQVVQRRARRVLWLHIHKSGGTFMCMMAGLAQEKVVWPSQNCNWDPYDMYGSSGQPDKSISCEKRMQFFDRGGYSWGQIERELWPTDRCGDNFTYGVMLREPLALMQSMVNFHPEVGKGFLKELQTELASPHVPVKPGQGETWKIMDNYVVRLLGSAIDVPVGQINETHLEAANATLGTFQIVQRLEDLVQTSGAMFESLGWPSIMQTFIHNKPNSGNHFSWMTPFYDLTFTQEETAFLRDINKYDIALYEWYR